MMSALSASVADVADALARAGCEPKFTRSGQTSAKCPVCGTSDGVEVRRGAKNRGSTIACEKECEVEAIAEKLGLKTTAKTFATTAANLSSKPASSPANRTRSTTSLRTFVTVTAAEVEPQPVRWLWRDRVPYAKLTVIEGQPGLGKTLTVLDLAARVSSGAPMPLEPTSTRDIGRSVLIISYEDDAADTLRPRLEAAGADLTRCHIVRGVRDTATGDLVPPVLPLDIAQLHDQIIQTNAGMVLIDPLMASLDAAVDAHRDQDVRRVLSRMRTLAESTGVAIVLVRHLRKAATPGSAITAGQGSIGIIGAARTAHVVAPDPADEKQRIFAPVKMNVGKELKALAYRIESRDIGTGITAPRIEWIGESEVTADNLTGPPPTDDDLGAVGEAAEWLRTELASGERRVREIEKAALEAGISKATLRRAKQRLGVVAGKLAYRDGWGWKLPSFPEGRET